MVRVLHLINGEHYAGAERVQDLLGLRLPELGFPVGFACLKTGSFAEVRLAKDAPLYDISMHGKLDMRPVWKAARIVRAEGYSLLHTHSTRGAIIGFLASYFVRVPVIHHVHSPAGSDSIYRWNNFLNALVEKVTLRRAAALIAVSQAMGAYAISQGNDPRRVNVVPNGAPVRGPLPPRREPTNNWTIGIVALHRPRKGLEVLLEALAHLRRWLSVRLRVVGGFETPRYEAEIKRYADGLGLADAIDWVGFTKDVDGELDRMDLFVLPSLFGEGLPMVILEAMAAGVPIVATRTGGTPEAIRDGMDGLLVNPGNPDELARAIDRIVSGEVHWAALRESAYDRQLTHFSDLSMARGVAMVYQNVLNDASLA